MADKGSPVEVIAVPVRTDHREWDKQGGGKGEAWGCVFKVGEVEKVADTYSKGCADVVEANLGKPVRLTIQPTDRQFRGEDVVVIKKIVSEDGSTELYSEGQSKRGGGRGNYNQRPDWSYQDKEEREAERRSIEAQVAEKCAADYFAAAIQYAPDGSDLHTIEGVKKFAEEVSRSIADRIHKRTTATRTSAKKSGSGQRESAPGPSGTRAASDHTMDAQEPQGSPPAAGQASVPTPGPDSSAELADARNAALEVYGSKSKVVREAAKRYGGTMVAFDELRADQLAELAAKPPESGAPQTEPEPAGMASGGWPS